MDSLIRATELKKELDELRPLSKEDEQRIMQKFRLDWNYHSNHLEGNSLNYGETKALILFGITAQGKSLRDHIEVEGHNEAVQWILEVVKQDRPLTENFIRELHKLILKGRYQVDAITPDGKPTKKWIEVGEYKSSPNHVKTKTGDIFYFATPEETPAKMQDLLSKYRKEKEELNPILLVAKFHYDFIRIHPFGDGNGRTARILMNFILLENGYPPVVIKTEDKANYFAVLQMADAGNLNSFVEYIAENLNHSLDLMIRGAKGESIEEEDDVDKQLRLLEERVKGLEINNIEKSQKVSSFLGNHFLKILDFLENEITPIKKYYKSFFSEIMYENKETQLMKKLVMLNNTELYYYLSFKRNLKKIIKENKLKNDSLNLFLSFSDLNIKGVKSDFYSYKIKLFFNNSNIEITTINSNSINIDYNKQPKEILLKKFIKPEIKKHIDFINQKLDEAKNKD